MIIIKLSSAIRTSADYTLFIIVQQLHVENDAYDSVNVVHDSVKFNVAPDSVNVPHDSVNVAYGSVNVS